MKYPAVRRDNVIDKYHSVKVPDPYRWLEDPHSEETKKFVKDQQETFQSYFKEHEELHKKIKHRLTDLYNFKRVGCPIPFLGRYILIRNSGLQEQDVCYISDSLDDKEGKELLNPNKLSSDGTVAITEMSISNNGKYMAYSMSKAGSDWRTIKFKKLEGAYEDLPDIIEHAKFTHFQWASDNSGGFYNVYKAHKSADGTETSKNVYCKTYFHRLGNKQEDDVLVLEFPSMPEHIGSVYATVDGRYIVASIFRGLKPENRVWIHDLEKHGKEITGHMKWQKLFDKEEFKYEFLMNSGSKFYFLTNCDGADRHKVIAVDIDHPEKYETIVPEDPKENIENCCAVGRQKYIMVNKIRDVKNILQVYEIETSKLVETIDVGMATIINITTRRTEHEIFYAVTSYLSPSTVYRIDVDKPGLKPEVYCETKFSGIDSTSMKTEQVFYTSSKNPNIRIPMYITHRKDMKLDGSNPTALYGYGGFDVSVLPSFHVLYLLWVHDFNGILAVANVRGGGEYGEKWHRQGQRMHKKNSFYDFCDAAEYLIKEKYTSPDKISTHGGSNGGLLVTASANLRKDLFRLLIPQVSILDMLRYQHWTIGNAWISEYGCSRNELEFQYLYSYSPLHNIPDEGPFPAVLCITADHDDRVVPAHTMKYIAELQHKLGNRPEQKHPLLAFIENKVGHGEGKPMSKIIENEAIILTVVSVELNAKME